MMLAACFDDDLMMMTENFTFRFDGPSGRGAARVMQSYIKSSSRFDSKPINGVLFKSKFGP